MKEEKNDCIPTKAISRKMQRFTVCLLLLAYLFLFAAEIFKTAG